MFAKKINDINFLKSLVEKRGYSVIDTRSPIEYRNGTLFNAPNAPLRNFLNVFIPMLKESNKRNGGGSCPPPPPFYIKLNHF